MLSDTLHVSSDEDETSNQPAIGLIHHLRPELDLQPIPFLSANVLFRTVPSMRRVL